MNIETSPSGTIIDSEDVKFVLPPGLVNLENETITVADITDTSLTGSEVLAGPVYEIKISNRNTFDQDLKISLPINPDFKGESCGVYYLNERRNRWIFVGGDVDQENGMITFDVNHLTKFAVFDTSHIKSFDDVKGRWSEKYVNRLVGMDVPTVKGTIYLTQQRQLQELSSQPC